MISSLTENPDAVCKRVGIPPLDSEELERSSSLVCMYHLNLMALNQQVNDV
jgi:hypothetical protein